MEFGSDPGIHRIEWRIERVASPAQAEILAQAFNRPIDLEILGTGQAATTDLAPEASLLGVSGDGVVSTLKPATRGTGVILRMLPMPGPVHVTLGPALTGKTMTLVDLAERRKRHRYGDGLRSSDVRSHRERAPALTLPRANAVMRRQR